MGCNLVRTGRECSQVGVSLVPLNCIFLSTIWSYPLQSSEKTFLLTSTVKVATGTVVSRITEVRWMGGAQSFGLEAS